MPVHASAPRSRGKGAIRKDRRMRCSLEATVEPSPFFRDNLKTWGDYSKRSMPTGSGPVRSCRPFALNGVDEPSYRTGELSEPSRCGKNHVDTAPRTLVAHARTAIAGGGAGVMPPGRRGAPSTDSIPRGRCCRRSWTVSARWRPSPKLRWALGLRTEEITCEGTRFTCGERVRPPGRAQRRATRQVTMADCLEYERAVFTRVGGADDMATSGGLGRETPVVFRLQSLLVDRAEEPKSRKGSDHASWRSVRLNDTACRRFVTHD